MIDAPIEGTDLRPSIYPLDDPLGWQEPALSCFLRDGEREDLLGAHGGRSRADHGAGDPAGQRLDQHPSTILPLARPDAMHDILIQQNHGYYHSPVDGSWKVSAGRGGHPRHPRRQDRVPQHALGTMGTSSVRAISVGSGARRVPSPRPAPAARRSNRSSPGAQRRRARRVGDARRLAERHDPPFRRPTSIILPPTSPDGGFHLRLAARN